MAHPTDGWRPPARAWREQDLFDLPADVHHDLIGTIGPDDAVTVDEPWPMRSDPSAWPR
ncbi:hypothetical protein V6V47_18785 [Micromonospora sp. CPCC 205539]|uniref:hypothetical protein n=1 Tax=Micromonospora sp. CPCC 205539 TaxID=3122408 RepID=UPI002FEE7F93